MLEWKVDSQVVRQGVLLSQHCAGLVNLSIKAGNHKEHHTSPSNISLWLTIYTWPLANLWVMDQGLSLRVESFTLEQAHIGLCMEFSFSFFKIKKKPEAGEMAPRAELHRRGGLFKVLAPMSKVDWVSINPALGGLLKLTGQSA